MFSEQLRRGEARKRRLTGRSISKVGSILTNFLPVVLAMPFVASTGGSLLAQTAKPASTPARAQKFEIRTSDDPIGGSLYVTVNGRARKIYDPVFAAWIISDGRSVVFSSSDGSGGFENEGQSLRIHSVQTRVTRKIMSEYSAVSAVQAVKISSGALDLARKDVRWRPGRFLFRDRRSWPR